MLADIPYIDKRHLLSAAAIFFAMVLMFSFARSHISAMNSWLLVMTGEAKVGADAGGDEDFPGMQISSGQPALDMSKPSVTDLPRTAQVYAVRLEALPPRKDDPRLVRAPPLRSHTGQEWPKEVTDLWLATDGANLHVRVFCHDAHPENLCLNDSRKDGKALWNDDGIEFFIMKDRKAPSYCQYLVSPLGLCDSRRYAVAGKQPHQFEKEDWPAGTRFPYVEAAVESNGYRIEMEIALEHIDIAKLSPGDEILFQVVRNYRGPGDPDATNLQLFPVHVHADNRLGRTNHHRGAFQPLQIISAEEGAKLSRQASSSSPAGGRRE